MLLYGYGLSYTKAGEIVGVSHEAVEQDKRMVSERKKLFNLLLQKRGRE
jgi:hypothetical protein